MSQPELAPNLAKIDHRPVEIFTYEPFANQPEYKEANRRLVEIFLSNFPPSSSFHLVDVATGTGLVPKLIGKIAGEIHRKGKVHVIGIDPNPTSLAIARATTPNTEEVDVEFIEGRGQNLRQLLEGKIPEDGVKGVTIHDAIHEIKGEDDKRDVIKNMANLLKNGGFFSYNSAFTTIAMGPSAIDWGKWKMTAFKLLNGIRDKEIKLMEIYKPEEYRKMIEDAGLVVIHEAQRVVNLSKRALAAISLYPRFIEGVFLDMRDASKVSLGEKSWALISALDQMKVEYLQRIWHEIIAQKQQPKLA